jgi:hypothetical protein
MSAITLANHSPLKLKDSRGAIMVLGIFFACMMIGWMWMLIGLGDAMIWRDRSQEAADAMSYSSAAVQAQGMNLISFINVLMLILTAVYLLMSFIYNVLDLLHVLIGSDQDKKKCFGQSSCGARQNDMELLSMVPYFEWLQPIADYWCDAANIIGALHDGNTNGAPSGASLGGLFGKYEKVMIKTMPILSKFEDFVSYATPWAGELIGIYTATQYKDWGKDRWGLPISATLIPATFTPGQPGSYLPAHKYKSCDDKVWEEEGKCVPLNCDAQDPNNCAPYNGGDKREGLPVAIPDSGFSAVCDYAGAKLSGTAKSAISGLIPGPIGTVVGFIVGTVLGALGDAFTNSYCHQDSAGLFSGVDVGISILRFATAAQMGGWNNKEKCPNDNWGHGDSGGCGGPKQCENVYDMKLGDGNQFWQDPVYAGGPHLVVDYAANGNDWMQVWGAVWGGNRVEQAEKKVAVAGMDSSGGHTWSSLVPGTSTESLFNLYLAQAEFYFDCEQKWGDEECNKDSNASYNMNWRARLRRMHGLSWGSDLLGYLWNGSLGSTFDDKAKEIIGGAVSSTITNPIAGKLTSTVLNQGYSFVKGWAGDQIGSMFQPASAVPDFIH